MSFQARDPQFGPLAVDNKAEPHHLMVSRECDALTDLAADVLDCPIALLSVFCEDGEWFQANSGFVADTSPRDLPFYEATIAGREPLIVEDARLDDRFRDDPLVAGKAGFAFYAGVPITFHGDQTVGILCVLDTRPRNMTDRQLARLVHLAHAAAGAIDAFENKRRAERARQNEQEKDHELARVASVLEQVTRMSGVGGWELVLEPTQLTWTDETKRIHEVPMDFEPQLDGAINFYAPEARPVITQAVETAIETGTGWDLELPMVTARGRKIWVRAVGNPVYKNGSLVSLIGAFQDISERRRTETRIRESEAAARKISEELRAILDNMGDGVSVFDSGSNLVIWNRKYAEIFDIAPNALREGVPFRHILEHENSRAVGNEEIDEQLREITEKLEGKATAVRRFRTGKGRIINSTHSPLPNGGWVGTHSDITTQVATAEQAQAVIRTVVDGIITIDDEGTILEFNPACEVLFGYTLEEVRGRNVTMLMPAREAALHTEYLQRFIAPVGQKAFGMGRETNGLRKDGTEVVLEVSVSTTTDEDRRTFTGILRDITKRKQMDRMKDQFVSTVNHEIRTPLTAIRGSLGLLETIAAPSLDAKSRRLLQLSLDGCDRLSNLVNDILDMEKIASGKMDYRYEVVDISDLVKDVVERHISYAELHEVTFEMQPAPHPVHCWVDRGRFSQALVNLLSNAAKFSPSGGQVKFIVRNVTEDWVRIEVVDQGPGIPEEFAPKVFEKFTQADSSSSRHRGGSGLGLSIARDIITAFGGSIDFDSNAGSGTTFRIDLPIVESGKGHGGPTR